MENTKNIDILTKSNLTLTDRNKLSISGIKKVKSTEPGKVIAALDNCLIVICGSNLSVQNVSLSTGILDLTGMISSISYSGSVKRKFSLKNIFK